MIERIRGVFVPSLLVIAGCATTPKPVPNTGWKQWPRIQSCLSGPDPYSNGIPGGTTYRWVTPPGGAPMKVIRLPYWPEGCEQHDVERDGDVDLRDVWRLLP